MEDSAMTLIKRTQNSEPFFDGLFNGFDAFNGLDFVDTKATIPAANIKETNDDFVIDVAAPGMDKADFKITLENNVLSIVSERSNEANNDENKGEYSRREFCYQSFKREFTLPEKLIQTDKVEAAYTDGILHITLPKREEAKPHPAREIAIA